MKKRIWVQAEIVIAGRINCGRICDGLWDGGCETFMVNHCPTPLEKEGNRYLRCRACLNAKEAK